VRIFKLKAFARFMQRERITDAMLCKAVAAPSEAWSMPIGRRLGEAARGAPGQGKSDDSEE
jgi:hypothetical protein